MAKGFESLGLLRPMSANGPQNSMSPFLLFNIGDFYFFFVMHICGSDAGDYIGDALRVWNSHLVSCSR